MAVKSYRDLRVWQAAISLSVLTYELTRAFPREESFGLTSQMRRAAASVPANIAEGYGRGTRGAYVNFLRIAQGSLKELETHTIIAAKVGVSQAGAADRLLADADKLGRMLNVLISRLSRPPIANP